MANLERGALPRIVHFEADSFDMATDNCASRTCTPFLTYLYEFESVDNATLTGVGTGRVTHMGKAEYVFLADDGKNVVVDDHKVLVCPNLPSQICSELGQSNGGLSRRTRQDAYQIRRPTQLDKDQPKQSETINFPS
jgi:hypothetical protein